jgi:uncharacterized protein (TIGR03382 family)
VDQDDADGECPDTGDTGDSEAPQETDTPGDTSDTDDSGLVKGGGGCTCGSAGGGVSLGWLLLLGLPWLCRRRK